MTNKTVRIINKINKITVVKIFKHNNQYLVAK